MRKVVITGNCGGGKSLLGKKLAQVKRLPLYDTDKFLFNPGWQRVPEDQIQHILNSLAMQDQWIIEGLGPWDCIVSRLQQSDTIVFIDFPMWIHLWWAAKRWIRFAVAMDN